MQTDITHAPAGMNGITEKQGTDHDFSAPEPPTNRGLSPIIAINDNYNGTANMENNYIKKLTTALVAIIIGSATLTSSAIAGPATEALSTCLSDNTTGKERKDLAKWVFIGMSAHPDMQDLSNITDANREEADRMLASIVTRLMTENCRSQAKLAMEKEGAASFQSAFAAIGKLAMQELMSNPKVNSSFTNYSKYLDTNKINSAFSNR